MTWSPEFSPLIDYLLERGVVRHIDAWTDEEAERCRLVAFDLAQRRGPVCDFGELESSHTGGARMWWRRHGNYSSLVAERIPGVYDLDPDRALTPMIRQGAEHELFIDGRRRHWRQRRRR